MDGSSSELLTKQPSITLTISFDREKPGLSFGSSIRHFVLVLTPFSRLQQNALAYSHGFVHLFQGKTMYVYSFSIYHVNQSKNYKIKINRRSRCNLVLQCQFGPNIVR